VLWSRGVTTRRRTNDVAFGTVNRTAAETRQFAEAAWVAFPDLRFELTGASVEGTRGVAEWTMMGTHRGDFPGLSATGKAFTVRGVSVLELSLAPPTATLPPYRRGGMAGSP
jgi:predicted ester cyclase